MHSFIKSHNRRFVKCQHCRLIAETIHHNNKTWFMFWRGLMYWYYNKEHFEITLSE